MDRASSCLSPLPKRKMVYRLSDAGLGTGAAETFRAGLLAPAQGAIPRMQTALRVASGGPQSGIQFLMRSVFSMLEDVVGPQTSG